VSPVSPPDPAPRPPPVPKPQLAIIIPHYNDADRLARCLRALAPQLAALPGIETLVVDNASPTDPAPLVAGIADAAGVQIACLRETARGAAAARNRGVHDSTAPLIAFLDCDCVPAPDWLARCVAAAELGDLVGGRVDTFDETPPPRSGAEAFETVFAFHQHDYVTRKGFSVTANLVTRRDVFLTTGDMVPGQAETQFEVSTVNIEANGYRSPIPYVLPPGIEREVNLGTIHLQQKNEQSMAINICNLADGDSRGVYKTTDFDLRQFNRLKMYVHAEKATEEDELKTGDLTAFIRMGSDFTQDYYEYEVPLEFTPWNTSSANPRDIWPENNELDLELSKLVDAKRQRNDEMNQPNSNLTSSTPYSVQDGNRTITVVGNPSLSDVKAIMIGVRNPKKRSIFDDDDGLPKCAAIWFNELRLTDFNDQSGWAATARMNALLADIGNVMVSGSYSTPGFGSIEKKGYRNGKLKPSLSLTSQQTCNWASFSPKTLD